MKSFSIIFGVLLSATFLTIGKAAETTESEAVPASFNAHPGPVADLRNQDSAFSLLIESYRQMQSFMIDSDYEKTMRAAALVKDPKERDHIAALAAQERDLRLAKLRNTLGNFNAAYDSSRHDAEKTAGVSVPNSVDTKAANEKLRNFVPFTPSEFAASESQPSSLLPAGAKMIYSQRR